MSSGQGHRREATGQVLTALIIAIVLATFGARASNSTIPTYMQFLGKQFDFSKFEIGLMAVAFMLSSFVASSLVNARLSAKERRKFFIGSAVAYAVVYPLYYFSTPITVWIIAVVAGFTMGPIMPNIMTAAGSVPERKVRERLLALYTLVLSISLMVAMVLSSVVTIYFTVREAFVVLEPLALMVAVVAPFLRFPEEGQLRGGGSRPRVSAARILSNEGFIASVLNNFTYQVPFSYITAFAALFAAESFGVAKWLAIMSYVPFYVTSFISRLAMSVRPPENLVRYMALAPTVTIAGLILAWLSHSIYVFFIAMAILGVPHGMTYTLSVIGISRTFRAEELNAANSYFFSTMMVLGSVLPGIIGAVADAIGYRDTFLALVPVVVAVLLATMVFASRASGLRSPLERQTEASPRHGP